MSPFHCQTEGMKGFTALLLLVLACGGSAGEDVDVGGSWCCDNSRVEPSSSAQHLTCYLTAEQAAQWSVGSCSDSSLPGDAPLHPGDSH